MSDPVICMAKSGDSKPQPDGPGKADFSAYWALKIREWFDGRKRYSFACKL